MLWAAERYLRETRHPAAWKAARLQAALDRELGWVGRVSSRAIGPLLHWALRRDARNHPHGRKLEPRTFVDRRNYEALKQAS